MSDPRLPRALHTGPLFPNNGYPARPGEDRAGLSPFGRLAMGGVLGKPSILIYDHRAATTQDAETDMITVEGDNLDAQQLILTLHPPRVIPLSQEQLSTRLDKSNVTGEQSNAEVTPCNFPGTDAPIRWPPLEALIEFGIGGTNMKVVVDYMNGVTIAVCASFLRVSALVTQNCRSGDIYGTSAAYYLSAHVGPGFAESHAQRTIFIGDVDDKDESEALDVPKMAKIATLVGRRSHEHHDHDDRHHGRRHPPTLTRGWIRFWQSPDGTNGVGDFFAVDSQARIEVPNGALYFSVFNESGHEMKMAVVFELAL